MEFYAYEWQRVCEEISNDAAENCSSSHDVYVSRYSEGIDSFVLRFPQADRDEALEIARKLGEYATLEERKRAIQWNAENGFCPHGIEWGCCPAGCGSY